MKESSKLCLDPKAKELAYNPTVEQLYAPEVGKNAFGSFIGVFVMV